eukprot:3328929-Rhodomonas_salina.3
MHERRPYNLARCVLVLADVICWSRWGFSMQLARHCLSRWPTMSHWASSKTPASGYVSLQFTVVSTVQSPKRQPLSPPFTRPCSEPESDLCVQDGYDGPKTVTVKFLNSGLVVSSPPHMIP